MHTKYECTHCLSLWFYSSSLKCVLADFFCWINIFCWWWAENPSALPERGLKGSAENLKYSQELLRGASSEPLLCSSSWTERPTESCWFGSRTGGDILAPVLFWPGPFLWCWPVRSRRWSCWSLKGSRGPGPFARQLYFMTSLVCWSKRLLWLWCRYETNWGFLWTRDLFSLVWLLIILKNDFLFVKIKAKYLYKL